MVAVPAGPDEGGSARSYLIGAALMLLAGFLFVCMDAVAKRLVVDHSFIQVTWGRYMFHMVPLLAWIALSGRLRLLRTRRPALQLGRSALIFISSAVFVLALYYLPLADAVVLNYSSPLLVTALSVPLLAEKVGIRRWSAVLVGFLGVLVVMRPGLGVMHWAVVLPLVTATSFAFYNIATRILARTDDSITTIFYTGVVGTVVGSAAAPFLWTAPDAWGWAGLVAIGLLGFFGHFAFIKAFAFAPPSFLAPLTYFGLIWATLIGLVWFGSFPDGFTLVGMAIIAGSGLYILYRESVRRREAEARGPEVPGREGRG